MTISGCNTIRFYIWVESAKRHFVARFMSYRWFLFQCRPPVLRGFLFSIFDSMKYWPVLLLLIMASCSKDGDTANDTTSPVIVLSNPSDGQSFTAGQAITISGSVTDDNYIAEIHIHVSNNNTGVLLMDVHLYPAGASATFSQSLTSAAGVTYKIQVIAKDKAVNEGRSTVLVSGN